MTTAAVILAAGGSSRFGSPKWSVRIGSRTMLEIVGGVATAAGLSPVVTVAPSAASLPPDWLVVANDDIAAGMSHSLRLGIRAVPERAEAAVVLLADQPTVEADHLRSLEASRGKTPIVATRSDDVLGPPALIEREAFELVDATAGDAGLRHLLRIVPALVTAVEHAPIPDVDTPQDLERVTEACPGCATRYLPQVIDGTHPYIGASPACWATFGEVLARVFGDVGFGPVRRHAADVYAVQHPGPDGRRQRQSVALHLVGLCLWLEHGLEGDRLHAITARLARDDRPWPWLPPPGGYGMTVVDLLAARDGAEHVALLRGWAEATWDAWSAHRPTVRAWARDALGEG